MKNGKLLLVISGPTATGKTALAVKIAQKYHGELINADSCQIYRGLDIGVGKDHPKDIPIHLIDIINPDQTFSSAEYCDLALKKIQELHSKNILPIVVGGTGFYIDSLLNPKPTFSTKPNSILRFILNQFPVSVLQKVLKLIDKPQYQKLNNSDLHNPHRLIRKIEIRINKIITNNFSPSRREGVGGRAPIIEDCSLKINDFDTLHLSLTAPNQYLYNRIDARVKSRLKLGHFKELKNLLKKYSWSDPGLKVSCYKVFKVGARLASAQELENAIAFWQFAEHRDARHQKTWFKKYAQATFIDITSSKYPQKVLTQVSQWYNK